MATSFIVTSTADSAIDIGIGAAGTGAQAGSQVGTLREALNYANANPGTTITFAGPGVGTILLQADLPLVAQNTTITGQNGVVIDGRPTGAGAATYRGFLISGIAANGTSPAATTVGISDLTIQNVEAQGGAGTAGGGGGLGAGGAVFVGPAASVTLTDVDVSNASAVGGLGGTGAAYTNTGGGGGLSGSGGASSGNGEKGGGGGGGILFAGGGSTSTNQSGGGGGGGITAAGGTATTANGAAGGAGLGGLGGGGGGAGLDNGATGGVGGGTGAGAGSPGSSLSSAFGGSGGFGGGGGGGFGGGSGGFGGGGGGGYGGAGAPGGGGGFGGGGGGSEVNGGGSGGFGGGGGSGGLSGTQDGTPGFGASAVKTDFTGGDGAGLGGAIFVAAGGSLEIDGASTEMGGTAQQGGGAAGSGYGAGVFYEGTANGGATASVLTFGGTGVQSYVDAITDLNGAARNTTTANGFRTTSGNTTTASTGGVTGLDKVGTGRLTLSGANTYTGGSELDTGTLDLNAATTLNGGAIASGATGTGPIRFGTGAGVLRVEAQTFNTTGTVNNLAYVLSGFSTDGDVVDLTNLTGANATTSYSNGVLTVTSGGMSDTLTINAAPSGYQYAAVADTTGGGGTDVVLQAIPTLPSSGGGGSPPTPASNPTITGTHATPDTAERTVQPFSGVMVADGNAGATDGLAITLTGGGGTLAGQNGDLVQTGANSYSLAAASPATLTAELDALTFTPTNATPSATATTTFTLTDTSSAGTSATDSNTVVTDTAAAAPAPAPPPAPSPIPVAPGSGGAVGTTPADAVSISPTVTYADGVFTLTGTASSPAGVSSVDISAEVDGTRRDLGLATVNPNGSFSFKDTFGPHLIAPRELGPQLQSFFTATETDGAGRTATSADPGFNLTGGLAGGAGQEQTFSATAQVSTTLFRANGLSSVDVQGPDQTVDLQPYDIVENHREAGTSFVYTPGAETDAVDVIGGFKLGGTGHSTLDLPSADFANLAAVLRNTGDVAGSAFITDPKTGDAIRLAGVTTAELKQHPKDFTFHG